MNILYKLYKMSQENNNRIYNSLNPIYHNISEPYIYNNMEMYMLSSFNEYINNILLINNIEETIIEQVSNESMNDCNLREKKNINLLIKKDLYNVNNFKEHKKCCICLSDFDENEEIGITDCFHVFHYCCLIDWGKYKTSCPLCLEKIDFEEHKNINEHKNIEEDNNEEDNNIEEDNNEEDNNEEDNNEEDNNIEEEEDNNIEEEDNNILILMSITNCSRQDALYSIYVNSNLENAILYLCENNNF